MKSLESQLKTAKNWDEALQICPDLERQYQAVVKRMGFWKWLHIYLFCDWNYNIACDASDYPDTKELAIFYNNSPVSYL